MWSIGLFVDGACDNKFEIFNLTPAVVINCYSQARRFFILGIFVYVASSNVLCLSSLMVLHM